MRLGWRASTSNPANWLRTSRYDTSVLLGRLFRDHAGLWNLHYWADKGLGKRLEGPFRHHDATVLATWAEIEGVFDGNA